LLHDCISRVSAKRSNDRRDGSSRARLDSKRIRDRELQSGTSMPLHASIRAVRIQRSHNSFQGVQQKAAGTRADGSSVTPRDVTQRPAPTTLDVCISSVSVQHLQNSLDGASSNGPLLIFCIKSKRTKRGTA
jgi:hypothetical protein